METPPNVVSADSLPIEGSQPDPERDQLRSLAEKADYGEITQEQLESGTPEISTADSAQQSEDRAADTETPKEETPDNSDSSTERPRDEHDRFKPKEEQPAVDAVTGEPAQVKPSKAEKDEARLARNWQDFEAGKLKWQQEQRAKVEAAEARAAAVEQRLEELARTGQPAQGQSYSSQQYALASERFEASAQEAYREAASAAASGDDAAATRAVTKGDELMGYAQKARVAATEAYGHEYQEYTQRQQQGLIEARQKDLTALKEQHPEIADAATEDYKAMEAMYCSTPIFQAMPNGFSACYQVVKWKQAAEKSELTEKENKELRKQLKELQSRTAITGGGPTPHVEPADFDSLPLEKQGELLRRQVYAEDRAAYA